MKLIKPPYPNPTGSATYFYTHACHRKTAIDTGLLAIKEIAHQEHRVTDGQSEGTLMGDWVVESLIQGAWIREYHEWEKATKAYFDMQYVQNDITEKVDWRRKIKGIIQASHVDRVREELEIFSIVGMSEIINIIDQTRKNVNDAKHNADHHIDEAGYQKFVNATLMFWEAISEQECLR